VTFCSRRPKLGWFCFRLPMLLAAWAHSKGSHVSQRQYRQRLLMMKTWADEAEPNQDSSPVRGCPHSVHSTARPLTARDVQTARCDFALPEVLLRGPWTCAIWCPRRFRNFHGEPLSFSPIATCWKPTLIIHSTCRKSFLVRLLVFPALQPPRRSLPTTASKQKSQRRAF